MRIIHRAPDGGERTLADDVDVAETFWQRLVGVTGRADMTAGEALVFPFARARTRSVHTVLVSFPIDVIWVEDEIVQAVKTVDPWTFHVSARGDTIIELPSGEAAAVSRGDQIRLAIE